MCRSGIDIETACIYCGKNQTRHYTDVLIFGTEKKDTGVRLKTKLKIYSSRLYWKLKLTHMAFYIFLSIYFLSLSTEKPWNNDQSTIMKIPSA